MLRGENGYFGEFGGRFVAETLIPALEELETTFREARNDPKFLAELEALLSDYVGRPSALTFAARLTAELGGAKIYLKREDLNHTGAHKINNCVGQALLARRMGKSRLIAETGAGQHGVATATVAAHFGFSCEIFMGAEDVQRQAHNVFRMRLLGAKVNVVESGTRTLKDAMNEAMREWLARVSDTHYVIGSVAGPHPYPLLVREFQSVIGKEAKHQLLEREGRLPDVCVACVGGGSNAMGLFDAFVDDPGVALHGVEAAGEGLAGRHAATLSCGRVGILHGSKSLVLTDDDGQILPAHSISAGLDYPGVGPEHAWLKQSGRAHYFSITDEEALRGFSRLGRSEGILCALETAHAIAYVEKLAPTLRSDQLIGVSLSGRGDKDIQTVTAAFSKGAQ